MGNGADEGNLDKKGRRFMKKYLLNFLLIYFFVAGAYLIIRSGFETVADITTSLNNCAKICHQMKKTSFENRMAFNSYSTRKSTVKAIRSAGMESIIP